MVGKSYRDIEGLPECSNHVQVHAAKIPNWIIGDTMQDHNLVIARNPDGLELASIDSAFDSGIDRGLRFHYRGEVVPDLGDDEGRMSFADQPVSDLHMPH